MGQQALAVVYGVPMTAELNKSLQGVPDEDGYSELIDVCYEHEMGSDHTCLGVSVGTSIYAESGERELAGAIPVANLGVYLSNEIKAAEKQWKKLAATVLKQKKVQLPEPQLMLVTVERA